MANKSFGKVKVKKISPVLADIPEDCGYEKQFEHNIDMNSNGIMAECIEWCQKNCEGKWGWWFEQTDLYDPMRHNWEDQNKKSLSALPSLSAPTLICRSTD